MPARDKKDGGFSARIRGAMQTRGVQGPTDLARRLSTRLGRSVNRQTVYKWMNGDVGSIRVDVMLAVAAELNYSITWLSTGVGDPNWSVYMDGKKRELCNACNASTETAKDELISYAYRLVRISNPPPTARAPLHTASKVKVNH